MDIEKAKKAPISQADAPIFYLAQGTVRPELDLKDQKKEQLFVLVNLATDYAVTHSGEKYMVFMPKPGSEPGNVQGTRVCLCSAPYRISVGGDDFLLQILTGAALQQSKVGLELKSTGQKLELVGVKVPTPTEADKAFHR